MIYDNISSREVIRRVYINFNIKTTDWESLTFDWINEAIGLVRAYPMLVDCHQDLTLVSFRAKLPCDLKVLRGVTIDGVRQTVPKVARVYAQDSVVLNGDGEQAIYELSKTGYIISSNETGTIRIHYKAFPTEFDDELNMEIPMIVDNEKLLQFLEWYVLARILMRGYNHPVFKIGAQNPELDPMKQWKYWARRVPNSLNELSREERQLQSEVWRTMITNPRVLAVTDDNQTSTRYTV